MEYHLPKTRMFSLLALLTAFLVLAPAAVFLAVAGTGPRQAGSPGSPMKDSTPIAENEMALANTDPVDAAATVPEVTATEIVIDNFTFSPSTMTIAAGTKVSWVNRDDVPHTATSTTKPRLFDSGTLDTDDRFTHVFTTPGTYQYFCAVHPHMTGRIIVK